MIITVIIIDIISENIEAETNIRIINTTPNTLFAYEAIEE